MSNSPSPTPRTHSTLYVYMTRSHDYLRELLQRLLAAMAADAPDVRALWNQLDHGLLAHMEAEERFVLPAFARVDADEARALLREHGKLREELFELGIAVDLHYIRYDRSAAFFELLRRHAGREENLLYRWAGEHIESPIVQAIERHIAAQ